MAAAAAAAAASAALAASLVLVPQRGPSCPSAFCSGPLALPRERRARGEVSLRAESVETEPPPAHRERRGPSFEDRERYAETNQLPSEQFKDWTDYTRYALGVEDRFADSGKEPESPGFQAALIERQRAMGLDFGPQFVGMALSLGGVTTMPMGTLKTGTHWTNTALKIAQIGSTRRVQDIVIGMPLETDGSEGKIARLVRHFSQILADAVLLTMGPNSTVYLWDERFSTVYAAMRLITRPRFDGAAFKTWLDGQRGLNFGSKALLDAEAARTILEHWLEKDPMTEVINKERSERVAPSKEACLAYLSWKKQRRLKVRRPKEPAGPGKEGWEWGDAHTEHELMDREEYMRRSEDFNHYMEGMDNFGDRLYEWQERKKRQTAERERDKMIKELQDDSPLKEAFKVATGRDGDESVYDGWGINRPESWKDPGR